MTWWRWLLLFAASVASGALANAFYPHLRRGVLALFTRRRR